MTKVFVYGTLLRGHGNHRLLERARFLGNAVTATANWTMLHLGGFPGIVHSGSTRITGELYEVDDATLARLDQLEGHPNFYERVPIGVGLEDGSNVKAEGYVLPTSWLQNKRGHVIPDGIWGK